MRRASLLALLLLTACLGGAPRKPAPPGRARAAAEDEDPLLLATPAAERRGSDRWSIDAELPRSGDPAHPNVKVALSVVDVARRDGLWVRAGVRGSIVRGVVDLRVALAGRANSGRARSTSTSMIVVQAGHEGLIQLTNQVGPFVGSVQALQVFVVEALPDGAVDLDIAPYVGTTTVPGEQVSGATRVRVRPGQAVVVGGNASSYEREDRGLGSYRGVSHQRETLVLLSVDVLG